MKAALLAGGAPWIFVKVVTIAYGVAAMAQILPAPTRQVACYRPRPVRAAMAYGSVIVAGLVGIGCVVAASSAREMNARSARHILAPVAVGMYAPGVDTSYTPERKFARETGARVSYVLSYAKWPSQPFNARFARLAASHGATPVIQLLPYGASMRQVAVGALDASIRSYADQVRMFGHPVILSFGPEANGNWYGWGWGRTSPSEWVAAWRHVVTVFRRQHVANVTWMWTVNVAFPHSGPVSAYWPGAAYVGMVGIDGYFALRSDTFASLFGAIIVQVRKLTPKPILISETAVGPLAGSAKIASMFAGVKAYHLRGLVWFDGAQHDGIYHQDWRLEDNPAALAAFRAAVRKYQ